MDFKTPWSSSSEQKSPCAAQMVLSASRTLALLLFLGAVLLLTTSAAFICPRHLQAAADSDHLERLERHMADLSHTISAEPDYGNHYMRLAQAQSQLGDTAGLTQNTETAMLLGVNPARVHLLRGEHYLRVMMFDRAIDSFQTVVRAAPRMTSAWLGLWRSLMQISSDPEVRTERSARQLRELAEDLEGNGLYFPLALFEQDDYFVDPDASSELVSAGYQLARQGDYVRAIREFQRAVEYEFTNVQAFRGLAICYASLGQSERALSGYNLYLYLADPQDPEVPAIRSLIFDFYRERGAGR